MEYPEKSGVDMRHELKNVIDEVIENTGDWTPSIENHDDKFVTLKIPLNKGYRLCTKIASNTNLLPRGQECP